MSVPAVGAEDGILASQVVADTHGDRLLTDIRMAGSVDQSFLVRAGQLFF
jgi:hypothetical protein